MKTEPPSKEALEFFEGLGPSKTEEQKTEEQKTEEQKTEKQKTEDQKKEEQKIEEQKTEEDIEFKLKARPSKEDSLVSIKKQRDEAIKKNETFTTLFGENDPSSIKPVFEYLTEVVDGPITADSVNELVEKFKSYETTIKGLEERIQEKETKVNELDIRQSEEFKNDFQMPYEEAASILLLEFASVDGDKFIAPESTNTFKNFLMNNTNATAIQVKAELQKFVKEFKEESGEDVTVPSVSSLMTSLRAFSKTRDNLKSAYENWKETKASNEEKKKIEGFQQSEQAKKANTKMRKELAGKALREFDRDSIEFIEDKEIEDLFREEYSFTDKAFSGEEVPSYDKLLARGVQSRLWEKYSPRLKELIEFKEKHEEKDREGLSGSNKFKVATSGGKDWLSGK